MFCCKSNQIKSNQIFICSKPNYKITKTRTIQLIDYGGGKVLKRHWYTFPRKRKKRYGETDTSSASRILAGNKFTKVNLNIKHNIKTDNNRLETTVWQPGALLARFADWRWHPEAFHVGLTLFHVLDLTPVGGAPLVRPAKPGRLGVTAEELSVIATTAGVSTAAVRLTGSRSRVTAPRWRWLVVVVEVELFIVVKAFCRPSISGRVAPSGRRTKITTMAVIGRHRRRDAVVRIMLSSIPACVACRLPGTAARHRCSGDGGLVLG